jgi:hypothetical protein
MATLLVLGAKAKRGCKIDEDKAMMTLLRTLHPIAARRGDGLRPELLEMIAPSPACSDLEKVADVGNVGEKRVCASDQHGGRAPTAEIVRFSPQRR